MPTLFRFPIPALAYAFLLLISSCKSLNSSSTENTEKTFQTVFTTCLSDIELKPRDVAVSIKEGQQQNAYVRPTVAKAKELNQRAANAHLKRLGKSMPTEKQVKFALRKESKPIPRTGITVANEFPSSQKLPPPATDHPEKDRPLTVLRVTPEGSVASAPFVSLTFSRPMVAVTSHKEASRNVPVTIEPQPEGSWRWMGTRTLIFEPEDGNLPQATNYTVTVDKNALSADKMKIDGKRVFSFSTPPLKLNDGYPKGKDKPTDVPIFLTFNQRIDPHKIAESIDIIQGGRRHRFRVGSIKELAKDSAVIKGMHADAGEDRSVLLFPEDRLQPAQNVAVVIRKGAVSSEGPLPTVKNQGFSFRTYDKFTINFRDNYCYPSSNLYFRTNNSLDTLHFDSSMVKITPQHEGLRIVTSRGNIRIEGNKKPGTDYTIEFSGKMKDVYGQELSGKKKFTVRVIDEAPRLVSRYPSLSLADPASPSTISVQTINFRTLAVKVWRVKPSDWPNYYYKSYWRRSKHDVSWKKNVPGKNVANFTVRVDGDKNRIARTQIDLQKYLPHGKGHLIVWVAPEQEIRGLEKNDNATRWPYRITWLQVTDIGLDAWTDFDRTLAFATSLKDGTPLEGVTIKAKSRSTTTGPDGMAYLDAGSPSGSYILAAKENDEAILPVSYMGNKSSRKSMFHVFDDRSIYKPGEKVHIKGWVRKTSRKAGADLEFVQGKKLLTYSVKDARNNKIAGDVTGLSDLGGFDFSFDIPPTPNLGTATVEMRTGDHGYLHTFQIQEFRTPEFEVSVSTQEGPHFSGEEWASTVKTSYYAGGGLAGAPVFWSVRVENRSFTPPGNPDYSFGEQLPWFWNWYSLPSRGRLLGNKYYEGTSDNSGSHTIVANIDCGHPPTPVAVNIEASVSDMNNQAWNGKASTIVHPASYYVGLKSDKYYYEPGQEIKIKWIVTDVDGVHREYVPVKFKAELIRNRFIDGSRKEEVLETHGSDLVSTAGASQWSFTPKSGGTWKITAILTDEKCRQNSTVIRTYVRNDDIKPQEKVQKEKLMIFPDKKSYGPGDTAKLTIQAPFVPAEGVVLLSRFGVTEDRRISVTKPSTEIKVPIKEVHIPNVHVHMHLSGVAIRSNSDGEADTSLPRQPALAAGSINLSIPPSKRELRVSIDHDKTVLRPGERTEFSVNVSDAGGNAVPEAEVAVVVVDDAVLALSNYQMKDPLEVFYREIPSDVKDESNRPFITLSDKPSVASADVFGKGSFATEIDAILSGVGGLRAGGSGSIKGYGAGFGGMKAKRAYEGTAYLIKSENKVQNSSPVAIRSDFNPLAAFIPAGYTDKKGNLTARVDLPDNLTRYRVMVVAAHGPRHFGKAESNITARLPLMVRPSAPRFLNFGDSFELPVLLQNQTDDKLTVEVAVRAQNAKLQKQGFKLDIPPNDRVEVRFPASTVSPGTARFQVVASTKGFSDAVSVELPVWTPATSEAFATYGTVDTGSVLHKVKRPGDIWPQFGGVQVSTSSTALQALTDAFIYLYEYPFSCSEQLASRIISVAALKDVLHAFNVPDLPSEAQMKKRIESDIEELESRQNSDGGFGFWRHGQKSDPFASLHVIHALTRAQTADYRISPVMKQRAQHYLKLVKNHIPSGYSQDARRTVMAYSLYIRALGGEDTHNTASNLLSSISMDDWNTEALGWILYALSHKPHSPEVQKVIKHLNNRVQQTTSTAQFTRNISGKDRYLTFHSERRADAIVLEALIEVRPQSDLIVKLVRGLLGHRKAGRWGNTQENGFVLLALDSYFKRFESQDPDFVARAWLGSQYAGEHSFKKRSTETHQINIPMDFLADQKTNQNLVLAKEGKGRMYYRVGMTYAPKDLTLDPADHGFEVERTYEGMDDKKDVRRKRDGSWEVKAGARVKVTVMMAAAARRYHVALVDPLPAGFEALNPALAVTETLPEDKSSRTGLRWWSRPWYEHQNMRDERVEAFASLLYGGVYEYVYYARATTPGRFVVPPAKAEEMYAPETFGRSGSDRVRV
ncbi:MAG: MG2 domain-containing protein, partial [Fibrobacterota bacterium]